MRESALIKRLKRHTVLATIQRDVVHPTSGGSITGHGSSAQFAGFPAIGRSMSGIARAFLWQTSVAGSQQIDLSPAGPMDAVGRSVPTPPTAVTLPGAAVQYIPPMPLISSPQLSAAARQGQTSPEPVSTPPPVTPQSPPRAAPGNEAQPAADQASQDANWRRLQTIFRKHQEIDHNEPVAGSGVSGQAANPSAPVLPSAAPADRETAASESQIEPILSPRQASITELTGQPQPPLASNQVQTRAETAPELAAPPLSSLAEPAPASSDQQAHLAVPENRDSQVLTDRLPVQERQEMIQRQPDGLPPSSLTPITRSASSEPVEKIQAVHGPDQPVRTGPASRDDSPEMPETIIQRESTGERGGSLIEGYEVSEPEASRSAAQRLPLEAVWPVQSVQRPVAHTPEPDTSPVPQPLTAASQEEKLRSALQDVSPGQASESSVELVATRRPRPEGLKNAPPAVNAPSISTSTVEIPLGVKEQGMVNQPESPAETPVSEILSQNPDQPPIKASPAAGVTQAPVSIQRVPEENMSQPMINTVIGPLPGDLWELIGQPAPQDEVRQTHDIRDRPVDVREHVHSPEAPHTGVIQRAPEPVTGQGSPTTGQASETDSKSEKGEQTSEVDIDKLARKVYAQVRRKINAEWERVRRRL